MRNKIINNKTNQINRINKIKEKKEEEIEKEIEIIIIDKEVIMNKEETKIITEIIKIRTIIEEIEMTEMKEIMTEMKEMIEMKEIMTETREMTEMHNMSIMIEMKDMIGGIINKEEIEEESIETIKVFFSLNLGIIK